MPVKRLPSNPSLDHLKHQAKDLLKAHAGQDAGVASASESFIPREPSQAKSLNLKAD